MAMKTDMLGYQYDDTHPAFIYFVKSNPLNDDGAEKFAYHRPTKRILDVTGLQEMATELGYTLAAPEVGEDPEWLWANTGLGSAPVPDQDPTDAYGAYPGEFNGNPPADMAALTAANITPSPATAWTAGEYVLLADDTEVYWDGEAWVEGRAKPVITYPTDGQEVYSAYYPITGKSAKPGFVVELHSVLHPYSDGRPQDTTKARTDGTFVFAGTQAAADNEEWKVVSAGQESESVTVVTAEPEPLEFTADVNDLDVTVTITSDMQGIALVNFGDGISPDTEIDANDPETYTYAVADTYTITVTPPSGTAGLKWKTATKDVTVTEPEAEATPEPEPEPEPEPDPEPTEDPDTPAGGAA